MLGWNFMIYPQRMHAAGMRVDDSDCLATWAAGPGGTEWIRRLCALGQAIDLGGNGYPNMYVIPTGTLTRVLEHGAPTHQSPLIVGDDYVLPPNWTGNAVIDLERLSALPPEVLLAVEAWDQS